MFEKVRLMGAAAILLDAPASLLERELEALLERFADLPGHAQAAVCDTATEMLRDTSLTPIERALAVALLTLDDASRDQGLTHPDSCVAR
jgi:hypothetical protein